MTQAALAEAESELLAHALEAETVLFDRYVVRSKIAEGAVSSVYRAYDQRAEHDVALKVFDPLRSADPVARQRFLREFEILSKLNHPGVARSLRFEKGDVFDVLVLELVHGERLSERMRRGRLGIDEAVNLAIQIADALEACHQGGVVHRDLKPQNLIVHAERGPVILDFGVAWLSTAMTLTRTGAIIGSPKYLAPELFKSSDSDARADVYSLGAILYEALTGQPVRVADSVAEMAAFEQTRDPPRVSSFRPEISGELDQVVTRALAVEPERRWATARELATALRRRRGDAGRELETTLPCSGCQTPLIIDLPMCPGCGRATDWALEPGQYSVQLHQVRHPEKVAGWLRRRYGELLRGGYSSVLRRLRRAPVPLAVGASATTAEALAAQARSHGARAEVVRARRLIGPALTIPSASPLEIGVAALLHLIAVLAVGAGLAFFMVPESLLRLLPVFAAVAGVIAARHYVRRSLLSVHDNPDLPDPHPMLAEVRVMLSNLTSFRARRVAAAAVARAAPVLMLDTVGLGKESVVDVERHLRAAIEAALELDAHQGYLREHPRGALRDAQRDAEQKGDADRVAELAQLAGEITEASIAHDLAARRALEACRQITDALSTRQLPVGSS